MDFIQNHKLFGVVCKVELGLAETRTILVRLQIEVDPAALAMDRQGEGRLAHLPGS